MESEQDMENQIQESQIPTEKSFLWKFYTPTKNYLRIWNFWAITAIIGLSIVLYWTWFREPAWRPIIIMEICFGIIGLLGYRINHKWYAKIPENPRKIFFSKKSKSMEKEETVRIGLKFQIKNEFLLIFRRILHIIILIGILGVISIFMILYINLYSILLSSSANIFGLTRKEALVYFLSVPICEELFFRGTIMLGMNRIIKSMKLKKHLLKYNTNSIKTKASCMIGTIFVQSIFFYLIHQSSYFNQLTTITILTAGILFGAYLTFYGDILVIGSVHEIWNILIMFSMINFII